MNSQQALDIVRGKNFSVHAYQPEELLESCGDTGMRFRMVVDLPSSGDYFTIQAPKRNPDLMRISIKDRTNKPKAIAEPPFNGSNAAELTDQQFREFVERLATAEASIVPAPVTA